MGFQEPLVFTRFKGVRVSDAVGVRLYNRYPALSARWRSSVRYSRVGRSATFAISLKHLIA
jgi:hypothetical protein